MYNTCTLNDLSFSFARPEDAAILHQVQTIAKAQKCGEKPVPVEMSALEDYKKIQSIFPRLDNKSRYYFLATTSHKLDIEWKFAKEDRLVCGYGGMYIHQDTRGMFITDLYAMKSSTKDTDSLHTGGLTLAGFVRMAQDLGLPYIELVPENGKAEDWYFQRGFNFRPADIMENEMVLPADNYTASLAILEKANGVPAPKLPFKASMIRR